MFYRPEARPAVFKHNPFKAMVSPRPIAWVSTVDGDGRANLAPFSYFNAVGDQPPVVMFAPNGRKLEEPMRKDTARNVEETGEFVVNIVGFDHRDAMNVSAAPYEVGVDEFEQAGLAKAPCELVRAPRVAAAPIAFECKFLTTVDLPSADPDHPVRPIFGEVIGVHVDEAVIRDGRVDVTLYKPLARLGYQDYVAVEDVFEMPRPTKA